MIFTDEQFTRLSAFEQAFHTAVRAQYARYPGREALDTIHRIYTAATGDTRRPNSSCSTCTFRLVYDCGVAYFKDKDARAALAAQATTKTKPKPKSKSK